MIIENSKEKCLVLGGKGMLGHVVVKYLNSLPNFEVHFTTRNKGNGIYFDVCENMEHIKEIIDHINPTLVINCIGIVNHLITEENKDKTILINSYFPQRLANICKLNNSKLINVSTDCVFSGDAGNYSEYSTYSPTDFYGLSKAAGEIRDDHNLTIRTSIIGPEIHEPKKGLMEWFFSQEGKEIKGFKGAIWSGLTTLELAKKIVEMHEKKITGVINITSEPINKYDLLCLMKKIYSIDILINADNDLNCNRSMRSIRKDVSYSVPTHEKMLKDLKQWGERK
jgi:dTDP-4-dehydrorhamnose reductase